jgi:hypothetical protein
MCDGQHPFIGGAVALGFVMVFWPLLMLWWVFLLGGALVFRFSFLLYLAITLIAYVPAVTSNIKSIATSIPQLYAAWAWAKSFVVSNAAAKRSKKNQ